MSALFVVLPLALLVSSLAVVAFMVAVKRGEFDDLQTPARRILVDDEPVHPSAVSASSAASTSNAVSISSAASPERPDSR